MIQGRECSSHVAQGRGCSSLGSIILKLMEEKSQWNHFSQNKLLHVLANFTISFFSLQVNKISFCIGITFLLSIHQLRHLCSLHFSYYEYKSNKHRCACCSIIGNKVLIQIQEWFRQDSSGCQQKTCPRLSKSIFSIMEESCKSSSLTEELLTARGCYGGKGLFCLCLLILEGWRCFREQFHTHAVIGQQY